MTTCADLIARTRRHLLTETRDELNRLTQSVDSDDTSLTFDFDLGGVADGAILAVDLEEMHVWGIGTGTATVERGVNGTTAASHLANATVIVNPKFSPFAIFQALNEDLLDLSSPDNGLYQIRTVTVPYVAGTDAYDLTGVTDLIDILDVTYDANDGSGRWPSIPRDFWRLRRSQATADFPSGLAFTVNGYAEPGRNINVSYKAGFTQFTATTDNLTTTGLPATAADIPPLGAAVRLQVGAEVARNFLDQSETRRADEVPPGARAASIRNLVTWRQQRIEAESSRLYAQFPWVTA